MARDRPWMLGLGLLGVVVVLWVVSGFLVNLVSVDYNKPYFITYLNTGLMVLYLPGALRNKESPKYATATRFSVRKTALLSLQFFALWFLSNLLNNASYAYTTVQSATILASTSSFFTLIVGSWCGIERFTLAKLIPLIASIIGVVFVAKEDELQQSSPPTAFWGNIMAIGGALLYGTYTTLLKYRVGNESNLDTKMFFGFVGLFNIVLLWPLMLLLDKTGLEVFELPPNRTIWVLLALNGLTILVSDFFWVLAMLLTSPLVVTVGLSATIPLSMLGEMIFYHRVGTPLYFVGAALVLWSFFAVNRDGEQEHQGETVAHYDNLASDDVSERTALSPSPPPV